MTKTTDQTVVIVGASLTGAKAAETLRAEGFDGRLVLIGAEHERPYERPPRSKDYLRGEAGRGTIYVHDEGFYAERDIELKLGRRATSLNTTTSELALDDGERLRYDRLLLATGGEPRRLEILGNELDGVLYLRSVEDSDALRERLDRGGNVVVIGAGVVAGMNVNVWDVTEAIQRLIAERVAVEDRQLVDFSIPLADLAPTEIGRSA